MSWNKQKIFGFVILLRNAILEINKIIFLSKHQWKALSSGIDTKSS